MYGKEKNRLSSFLLSALLRSNYDSPVVNGGVTGIQLKRTQNNLKSLSIFPHASGRILTQGRWLWREATHCSCTIFRPLCYGASTWLCARLICDEVFEIQSVNFHRSNNAYKFESRLFEWEYSWAI